MQCTLDAQNTRKYKYHFHAAVSFVCLMGATDSPFLLVEERNGKCTAVNLALVVTSLDAIGVLMSPSGFRNLLEPPFSECNSLKHNIVAHQTFYQHLSASPPVTAFCLPRVPVSYDSLDRRQKKVIKGQCQYFLSNKTQCLQ